MNTSSPVQPCKQLSTLTEKNSLPVQPFNKFSNSKKNKDTKKSIQTFKSLARLNGWAEKKIQSSKQVERLHSPHLSALLNGPAPSRLILNRWHERGFRERVFHLNRELPQAERLARTWDREHIQKLYLYYTYLMQIHFAQAVDGIMRHAEEHPESTEWERLWKCSLEVSERSRRLKRALEYMPAPPPGIGSFGEVGRLRVVAQGDFSAGTSNFHK